MWLENVKNNDDGVIGTAVWLSLTTTKINTLIVLTDNTWMYVYVLIQSCVILIIIKLFQSFSQCSVL